MNFTASSLFYNKYLEGNEMTDFVKNLINDDLIPLIECYGKPFRWYKVRERGEKDRREQALRKGQAVPGLTCNGCLFSGLTYPKKKKLYIHFKRSRIFNEFCEEILLLNV